MPHVWALVTTTISCSICCVLMVVYAFDECTFPNLMLSNYIIYYPANVLANISWPLYAITHAYLEVPCMDGMGKAVKIVHTSFQIPP